VRILLVNWQDRHNPQAGGAEIHLHEIFQRLAGRGHRVRLVCSGWRGCAPREIIEGVEVERHGGRHSFALQGRGAVREALRREVADVVVEDINKIPLFLAGVTTLPLGVIVPHLFGSTAFREATWPVAALVWLLERPIPRAYSRAWFHAISESTRDDLAARGVAKERIVVIHPGVDGAEYAPDPAVARSASPTFLYLGRLRRYKGVEHAIRAVAIARRSRPDVRLDIAGTGEDQPRLERLAARLGVSDLVRFRGFVDEGEKRRLLRQAWANIFSSPKEGWGITNVEAAACGTPSLASDSPGLRDSVRHGQTGYLVPHADADALAARMLELASAPELVADLGRQARAFAESLTWGHAADETERWLEMTVNASRSGGADQPGTA